MPFLFHQVHTLELDAPLLDFARPYDLASLLDPPNGTCNLRQLVIASGGVPGPHGGPSGTATSATTSSSSASSSGSSSGSSGSAAAAAVSQPDGPLPGSVAAYYAASRDAELNGPLLSSRRRSSFNSSSSAASHSAPSSGRFGGGGDATPRDAAGSLAVLLGSLRANKSLQHLHLCLRPSDIDVEAALDEYAAAAAGTSTGSSNSGSGGSSRAQGKARDYRGQRDVGSAAGASEAPFRGAIPEWVTALGDCLAFNNTLESLLVRGDGARLAQACSALADALATV